jgi:hypothetical protein
MKLAVLLSLLLVPQMANAICEIPLVTDSTKVAKTGDTMTGSLIMSGVPISLTGSSGYINSESSITTLGRFFGPLTGNVTGNCSGTAGSLAATPTTAPSGYVSRGVDASGNAQTAWVESAATSGSTNPITSGAAYTALGLKAADSAVVHLAGTENITGAKAFQATGNGTYSLAASSGISVGQDVQVTGTVQANKFKGDGSQLTGIGGGGTVTTQGSPAAGQVPIFQAGTIISSSPIRVDYGAGGAGTTTITGPIIGWSPVFSSMTVSNVRCSTFTGYGEGTYLFVAAASVTVASPRLAGPDWFFQINQDQVNRSSTTYNSFDGNNGTLGVNVSNTNYQGLTNNVCGAADGSLITIRALITAYLGQVTIVSDYGCREGLAGTGGGINLVIGKAVSMYPRAMTDGFQFCRKGLNFTGRLIVQKLSD